MKGLVSMAANVKILGWQAKGLRCPDHTINLDNYEQTPHNISLIQMPNGTGKTTTLSLLRAALSGTIWTESKVKEFAKRGNQDGTGEFIVTLVLNDKRFTVLIEFDFEKGSMVYKTTSPHGQREGFNIPVEFRSFMKPEFVNFFVFDGELAENLLDPTKTDAEAVVETLFQIDLLKKMGEKTQYYWDIKTSNASATEIKGYSRRKRLVDSLREKLKTLTNVRIKLLDEKVTLTNEISSLGIEYENEIGKNVKLNEQFQNAHKAHSEAKNRLKDFTRGVLDLMVSPQALHENFRQDMLQLKEGLDRVKLPESAAKEFFVELAEEERCICGRPITEEVKKTILSRANKYLATDEVSLLNSMKSAVNEAVNGKGSVTTSTLQVALEELKELKRIADTTKSDLDFIETEINDLDPEAAEVKEKLEIKKERLEEIEGTLAKLNGNDGRKDANSRSIVVIEKLLQKAEKDLEEITNTLNLRIKRDILKQIFYKAYRKSQREISSAICNESNNRIQQLMPNNSIRIDEIDRCLVLEEQSGGSAGEQLSIAYSFLSTLFSRSDQNLPFIVDSPAGPIDLEIRPHIGRLVPKLTKQFVAFTISSEREGFVNALEENSQQPIQYLTIFRKGNADDYNLFSGDNVIEDTMDGYVVSGKEFFNTFQVEVEE